MRITFADNSWWDVEMPAAVIVAHSNKGDYRVCLGAIIRNETEEGVFPIISPIGYETNVVWSVPVKSVE